MLLQVRVGTCALHPQLGTFHQDAHGKGGSCVVSSLAAWSCLGQDVAALNSTESDDSSNG